MNRKKLVILILVVIAVVYFVVRGRQTAAPGAETQPEAVSEAQGSAQSITPAASTVSGDPLPEGRARVHYFTKEALAACSANTVTLEQAVDPKYGHAAAGALVAQTSPLPADAGDYVSAFAPGTRLIIMRISPEGVATADYSSALNTELNDCNRAQRRAQIVNTLKEFSQIKDVVITVNGQAWE